jgi:serine protease
VCAQLCASVGAAAENNGTVRDNQPTAAYAADRLFVIWKSRAETGKEAKLAAVAKLSGATLVSTRNMTPRMQVLRFAAASTSVSEALLASLRADPRVRYAEHVYRKFPLALPNDPDFSYVANVGGQWYLQSAVPAAVSNIHADAAWDISEGDTGIVIADLDTGIRYDHPDIARATALGRVLPGYDFIGADFGGTFLQANDGNGRDADASDPGDWVTATEAQSGPFQGCQSGASSWHGTRTAGIIGALTDNGVGIAGVNWNSFVLPVRVLGKCGGFDDDIMDGMRWAAGLAVPGAPVNPYPARVINMSLGGGGPCSFAYQDLFDELTAAGVTVVVSAGNSGGPVSIPANCVGAVAVAGIRHIGTKVGFSSLGPEITISAPGGNCVNTNPPCLFTIDTLTDTGTTAPVGAGYTDMNNFNVGTSFSAPLVSGVASLMLGLNQNLQFSHIEKRLRLGATKPFPVNLNADPTTGVPPPTCHVPVNFGDIQNAECNCTTATCGGGMLNAQGALLQALRPIASVALPATVTAGNNVSLTGSRSVAACGRTISSYQWSVLLGAAVIANPNVADTSVVAPSGTDVYAVRLTVTDDQGDTDTADITINPTTASSSVATITPVNSCPTPITVVQIAAPTSTFAASPTSIMSGQSSTLTWSSTDATGCTAGGDWAGDKTASGNQSTGALTATKTYRLTCDGTGGTTAVKTAVVTVTGSSGGGGGGGGGGLLGLLSLLGLGGVLSITRRRVRS